MRRTIGFGAVCLILAAGSAAAATVVIDTNSFFRWDKLSRPAVVAGESPAAGKRLAIDGKQIASSAAEATRGDLPAGWRMPDFDDATWARTRAAWMGNLAFTGLDTGLVVLRGKFAVSDPSAVTKLTLSLRYRGGVVVYVNGQEAGRLSMPKGEIAAATPALPYPDEIFLDETGKPYQFPNSYHAGIRIKDGDTDLARRLEGRVRSAKDVALPISLLRKGVNVLAVSVHRSDYHPSAASWRHKNKDAAWLPCGLASIELKAAGEGVAPNVSRPRGVQVWNADINDRTTVLDYGDPNEPLRPIRLFAARNGVFSGKVVVGSTGPIRRLKASASELRSGGGRIPASGVEVSYAVADGAASRHPRWFDKLVDRPPAEAPVDKSGGGAIQPVWVSVRVPGSAAPGAYRGKLTLSAAGLKSVEVPVILSVADWAIPDLVRARTYVGLYQSPTTLAMHYGVKEWSEPHWKLMARSFALLGELGSDIVNVPVVERTQFGNDEGMVYWLRQADGSFKYDFGVVERYFALVRKHLIDPDFVVLNVYHAGGWQDRGPKQPNTVTVVDAGTGKRESMQVPEFGTKESKAFWAPVLHALRDRLAKVGLAKALALGALSDGAPTTETCAVFNEIIPNVGWARYCHKTLRADTPPPLRGGGRVVLHEYVYLPGLPGPGQPLPPIWSYRNCPRAAFMRHEFDHRLNMLGYRTMAERALLRRTRGPGRMCLDFWRVKGSGTRRGDLNNRWPNSSTAQRSPTLLALAAPGPEGAVRTVRFHALRESIQDAEAAIVVAEAVDRNAEKLGPELAGRCRKLLRDRADYCRDRYIQQWQVVYFHVNHRGWEALTRRLYEAAAEVTRKLKG